VRRVILALAIVGAVAVAGFVGLLIERFTKGD
jgi:hypothetical protein